MDDLVAFIRDWRDALWACAIVGGAAAIVFGWPL